MLRTLLVHWVVGAAAYRLGDAPLVVLASVLGFAGVLKLLDPPAANTEFAVAVIGRIGPTGLRLVALAEVTTAVGLLGSATSRVAAGVAVVLLLAFIGALVPMIRAHAHVPCACFGGSNETPATWWAVARNASLIVLAVIVAVAPQVPWAHAPSLVFVVVSTSATLSLARTLRRQRHQSSVEMTTPMRLGGLVLPLATTGGGTVTLTTWLSAGRNVLVVFVDPICAPCRSILPSVARWQRASDSTFGIAVVSRGDVEENRRLAADFGLAPVAVQRDDELARWLGVAGTPSACLIGQDGNIIAGPVAGERSISALVDSATAGIRQQSVRHTVLSEAGV